MQAQQFEKSYPKTILGAVNQLAHSSWMKVLRNKKFLESSRKFFGSSRVLSIEILSLCLPQGSVDCGHPLAVLTGPSFRSDERMSYLSLLGRALLVRNTFSRIPTFTIAFFQKHILKDLWCLTFSPRTQSLPQRAACLPFFVFQEFHIMDIFIKTYQQEQEIITKP